MGIILTIGQPVVPGMKLWGEVLTSALTTQQLQ